MIYFIFRYTIKAIRYFSQEIEKSNIQLAGFPPEWARPTFNIVKFLLYAFMLVLVFPFLPGSSSTAFKGVSVFLGILLSLGSSSAITNLVAGLVITYMRPFKIGDRVKIVEVSGDAGKNHARHAHPHHQERGYHCPKFRGPVQQHHQLLIEYESGTAGPHPAHHRYHRLRHTMEENAPGPAGCRSAD